MTLNLTEDTRTDAHDTEAGIDCPSCKGAAASVFHAIDNVPTNSCILFESRDEAINCLRGDIRLACCPDCGFIFNAAFDQKKTEYSGRYEETQGFSPTFSSFHRKLAERLVERYDLHGKRVLEIGCGKGEFLILLSQIGQNEGTGIDPSALTERIAGIDGAERVTLVPEYFTPDLAKPAPDFLCCKMTLEHISQTADFIADIRAGLPAGDATTVFFQIPEALRILRSCAFEDIYYEHCSYFTPGSLGRLFRTHDFSVIDIATEYDDQYLTIEARPGARGTEPLAIEEDVEEITRLVDTFPARLSEVQRHWSSLIQSEAAQGKTIVLWGSGSKAVSFLTSMDRQQDIAYVTDINPNRHNHFMPGTGQRIVPPEELKDIQPDLVIVMNRIYEAEIRADLDAAGLSPKLLCL